MNAYGKRLGAALLFVFLHSIVYSQVELRVTVNSGSSTTTCTDGVFGGGPEVHWGVSIAGTGYDYYPTAGICYFNTPRQQFSVFYSCALPSSIQVCLRAFEDDGASCVPSFSCLVNNCQNFAVPAPGASTTFNLNVVGASTASMNFTIESIGSLLGQGNDLICDAEDLGVLASAGTLGDFNLSNYNNFCATDLSEPNPWAGNNDQGVWFQFTTDANPSSSIDVIANSDPAGTGDPIDLQVAIYESSNNNCTGALSLVEESYQGLGVILDETATITCPSPNTTYYILVDGEGSTLTPQNVEGSFGLQINNIGETQAADLICDAEDLGSVPISGSVATAPISQSNICAGNLSDPTPASWASDQTVWFQFQAPPSGSVTIDAVSDLIFPIGDDPIDIQLAAYSSNNDTCTGVLTELNSVYTPGLFDESLNLVCLTPGENYWVLVDGSAINVEGTFGLTISDAGIPPAPNDLICNAIDLGTPPLGGIVNATSQNNFCASNSGEPNPTNWSNDQGVWYSFSAPASGAIEVRTSTNLFGDPIDLQVAVYELSGGLCSGIPTELASEHDGIGLVFDEEVTVDCLTPGTEYFVLIDGEATLLDPDLMEGIFDIEIFGIDRDPPGSNNAICDAIALGDPTGAPVGTTPGVFHGSQNNFCADAIGEPIATNFTPTNTVWYTFTAPSSGAVNINVITDPILGGVDPIDISMALYNASSCAGPFTEEFSGSDLLNDIDIDFVCLNLGDTYFVQIDGTPPAVLNGDFGYFDITISEIPGVATSLKDSLCSAYDFGTIGALQSLANEDNRCSSVELVEPGFGTYATNTNWYQFQAPPSGSAMISIDSDLPWPLGIDAIDIEFSLFSSDNNACTGSLQLEAQSANVGVFLETMSPTCLVPGETYFIQVDGQALDIVGVYTISIEDPVPTYGTGMAGDPEPVNNECFNAIPLLVQSESCGTGSGIFEVQNYGQASISMAPTFGPSCATNCGDTWYRIVMPASGNIFIEGNDEISLGDTSVLTVAAYSGNCGALNPVFCDQGGLGADVGFTISEAPGTTVLLQVFSDGNADASEDFEICVSETCGFDNCLDAIASPMQSGTNYCFNTNLASEESLLTDPGYEDCFEMAEPEHSIYYYFETGCTSGDVILNLSNIQVVGSCVSSMPSDVVNFSLFLDSTTCDNAPDSLIQCLSINSCDVLPFNGSFTYSNLPLNSSFVILIDGGIGGSGNNAEGDISVTIPISVPDTTVATSSTCNPMDTGVFVTNQLSSTGCDSMHTQTVTLDTATFADVTIVACDSVVINSITYTSTTYFMDTLVGMNANGCDSIVTYDVSVNSCVDDSCGFDNCLEAVAFPVAFGTPYCINTLPATGEVIPNQAGYFDCSEAANPVHSQYYYFVTGCDVSDVTVSLVNTTINGGCILGVTPTDGLTLSLFEDVSPCDNAPDALLDCQTFTSCMPQPINWSMTYLSLTANTSYMVMLDGGFAALGGDVTGDLVVTSTVTSIPSSSQTITGCDSASVLGTTYLMSTIVADTLSGVSAVGCDSIVNYTITINSSDSTFATSTSCFLADTGLFVLDTLNSFSCDSVHSLTVTLLPSDSTFAMSTSCFPADTGLFVLDTLNSFGCDSVHSLTVTLLPSDSTFAMNTSCFPADTGLFVLDTLNSFGCDSVHSLMVTLIPTAVNNEAVTACDSVVINSVTFFSSTLFSDTLFGLSDNGCDSIVNYTITVNMSDSTLVMNTTCDPMLIGISTSVGMNQAGCDSTHIVVTTLLFSDSTFATSTSCLAGDTGVFVLDTTNMNSCDSVHTLTVTFLDSDSTFAMSTSCLSGDTGVFVLDTTNMNSCDSVHTLTVTFLDSDSTFAMSTSCLAGDTGVFVLDTTNMNSCDSVHTLTVTFLDSDSTFAMSTSCLPGDTGVFVLDTTNMNSCDSVHTLTVTFLDSDSTFAMSTSCLSGDTGVFVLDTTNVNSCDSVHTLTVTFLDSDSTFAMSTSCLVGDTGVFVLDTVNSNSCDSVHTLTVTFLDSDSTFASSSSCLVGDTGVFVLDTVNSNSCDSVHTLTVTFLDSDSTFASSTSCLAGDTGVFVLDTTNSNSCDSVHTLTVTFLDSDSTFASSTSCLAGDTGVFVLDTTNMNSCDSVHTLTVTFLDSDSTFAMSTSCLSGDTGVFVLDTTNMNSCDSVHTLTVTFLDSDSTFAMSTSCLAGDTGVFVLDTTNMNSCDSVHTLTVTLLLSDSTFATSTSCLSGDTGVFVLDTTNMNSCDSVHTLTVTFLDSDSTFAMSTSCLVGDTGVFVLDTVNSNSCDSVHTLTVTFLDSDSTFASSTSCLVGDTGVFVLDTVNSNSCDSVHTLTVTFLDSDSTFASSTSCLAGDTGVFVLDTTNINSCDSVHTLTVTFLDSDSTFAMSTSCLAGDTGVFVLDTTNMNSCDSVHTLTVTFLDSDSTFASSTSCLIGDTGVFVSNNPNQFMCDSVHTLTITLLQSDSTFATATSCNPMDTGTNSNTFMNQANFDSVHTISTTLIPSSSSIQSIAGCDSIMYSGIMYYASTMLADTMIGAASNGCDSILSTMISLLFTDSTFSTSSSCNPMDTGVMVTTFVFQASCDSVHTETITLDLISTSNQTITGCDSIALNGQTWYTSTLVIDTILGGSVNGCDSLAMYNVVVNESDSSSEQLTSCNPLDTGTVTTPFLNQAGCDSVHTIVTTLELVNTSLVPSEDVAICSGFNHSISVDAHGFVGQQWFIDTSGAFELLVDDFIYSGTNTTTLTIANIDTSMNDQLYVIRLEDNCGRFVFDTILLSVFTPTEQINSISDFEVCAERDTILFVEYAGVNASWNTGEIGQYIQPQNSGEYIVNYNDDSTNCAYSDTINITINQCIEECFIVLPTAFSPNLSGTNDIFKILTDCEFGFSRFEFNIYNRWGELVYYSNNPELGWDGMFKGQSVPIGTYSYSLEYTKNVSGENGQLKGDVTVIF